MNVHFLPHCGVLARCLKLIGLTRPGPAVPMPWRVAELVEPGAALASYVFGRGPYSPVLIPLSGAGLSTWSLPYPAQAQLGGRVPGASFCEYGRRAPYQSAVYSIASWAQAPS
jgi:hypothetical protein